MEGGRGVISRGDVIGGAREPAEDGAGAAEIGDVAGNLAERNGITGRSGEAVEVFVVSGHPHKFPIPNGGKRKTISNAGFRIGRGFCEGDRTANGTGNGDNISNGVLQNHTIYNITNLLINIIALGIHVSFTLVLAKEFPEVTNTVTKFLVLTVIVGDTDFLQKEARMRFGSKSSKVKSADNTDARNNTVLHICVDYPSLFGVFEHFLNHESGLARTLFAEDKNEFVGVTESAGIKRKGKKKGKKTEYIFH